MKGRFLLITLICTLLFSSAFAAMLWYNWHINAEVRVIEQNLPQGEIKLGQAVDFTLELESPWYRQLEGPVTLRGSEDFILVNEVEVKALSYGLSGRKWLLKGRVLGLAEGQFNGCKLYIPLSADRDNRQLELVVSLPKISVSLLGIESDQKIFFNEQLGEGRWQDEAALKPLARTYVWLYVLGAAFILFVLSVLLKRSQREVKPWDLAQQDLQRLKASPVTPDSFFVSLTDILRVYLERRYKIRAPEKTREEFIVDLRQNDLVPAAVRGQLEQLLQTADLVKFACKTAGPELSERCLQQSREFICATIPQEQTS